MVLCIRSDTSYLSVSKARSRASGVFFLANAPDGKTDIGNFTPLMNGIIHVVCKILKNVMASAAEAELGAVFINGQDAVPIRTTLAEMNHPQPATPIQVDNSTAVGIANKTIRQRQSKAMDMRFYWTTDRINQGQFVVYWRPGPTNLGDYHSKHHPPAHHIKMRPTYLHERSKTDTLQGCVKSLNRYTTGKVHRVVKGDTRVAKGDTSGNQLRTTSIYR